MVILLAEDDVYEQYSIWKLLKADGFTVLTAGNGQFALEASRNHPGPVDLLLTDMEMPRMSGLGALQEHHGGTPWDQSAHDVGRSSGERTRFYEWIALPPKAVHPHGPAGFHRSVARSNPTQPIIHHHVAAPRWVTRIEQICDRVDADDQSSGIPHGTGGRVSRGGTSAETAKYPSFAVRPAAVGHDSPDAPPAVRAT